MPNAPEVPLPGSPDRYRVLAVGGRDATAFLQGQLTQDVGAVTAEAARPAALLSPAGRVVATPWLVRRPDDFAVLLPNAIADSVRERLARFVLRSKVTLTLGPCNEPLAGLIARALGAAAEIGAGWDLALVRSGFAEISGATAEAFIPQMLNLDLVGAISFTKGCYTGQEIVARTQHLGRIKRRLFRYACDAGPGPPPLAALLAGGSKAGEVVLAAAARGGTECLAVVNLDARGAELALDDGRPCRPLPLPYAIP